MSEGVRRAASIKVFRISGRDAVAEGFPRWFDASMKVFRISGRDPDEGVTVLVNGLASMKVFRISGRDTKKSI